MERYPPTAQQRPVRSDWQRDRHRFDGGLRLLHLGTCSVLVQILDGLAAACLGVLVPLVASDVAGRSGHFNLALGFVGLAIRIGATASTSLAGWIADRWGQPTAFAGLAAAGLAAMVLAWGAMPETRRFSL